MIVCVTGKMAAGKNAVAAILEKNGFATVDADTLVHKAIEDATKEIVNTFLPNARERGMELLKANGTLDRRALGVLVFGDKTLLAKQEAIVYPRVIELAEQFIAEHNESAVALNATALYKTPRLMQQCTATLFVTAPYVKRLFRAKKRDGMPICHIVARFRTQRMLYAKYCATGIPVIKINNSGSLKKLSASVARALKKLETT